MNKIIWALIIIILLVAAGYFFLRNGDQQFLPEEEIPSAEETVLPVEEEAEEEAAVPAAIRTFTVLGSEYRFDPSSIAVQSGETVRITFQNDGNFPHNIIFSTLGVGTRTISPGQTDTIEFVAPAAGTYNFICSVPGHEPSGMTGTMIVE